MPGRVVGTFPGLDWFRRKSINRSEARLHGENLNVGKTVSSTLHLSHNNERHASLLLTDSQALSSALEALELLSLTAAAGDNDENHTMM